MPSSCSIVVRNKKPSAKSPSRKSRRLAGPASGSALLSSPLITDGFTTEASLCEWSAWFARFHTDPSELYVPIALRTIDCQVTVPAQPQRLMLCVREVAKFNGAKGVEWLLVTWIPGLPGVQFRHCDSQDDAMRLLDSKSESLSL